MSLVMVTLFLFIVMLLIIGCVLISAGYAQRRQMRQRALSQEPLAAPTGRMMVVMQLQDGSMVGVERPAPLAVTRQRADFVPSAHLSSRWYRHQRMIVSLG